MKYFETDYNRILDRLDRVDPVKYASDRNYLDGSVSYLSPYISRGVISTKMVFEYLTETRGFHWREISKYIQELAWRDYFQLIWKQLGNIDRDIYQPQERIVHRQMPLALVEANTGINAVDQAIRDFYATGYLHNHMRMYIASLATNVGQSHWHLPAKWMYYHLLDADWGSNALSWQWVAGSFSHKKYFADQSNINKYTRSYQQGTFLDRPYEEIQNAPVPDELAQTIGHMPATKLPVSANPSLKPNRPVLVYNFYNLDPTWRSGQEANRILLLEPSFFKKYPVSPKTIDYLLDLSANIEGIKVFSGEFAELKALVNGQKIYFREHPTNENYVGHQDGRDWMFPGIPEHDGSFFKFWRKAEKQLQSMSGDARQTRMAI